MERRIEPVVRQLKVSGKNLSKLVIGILMAILCILNPDWARAFGISPPQVINDRLVPSAHYEQEITLSRAEAEDEVTLNVDVNTPGFEDWFSFTPGKSFTIAKGEKVSKLKVLVDVPSDAKPGRNRGTLRLTVTPKEQEIGKINIVLGAQIDVDLTVTAEKISEMTVKQVKIPDLETGWKVLVVTRIENSGNMQIAPDKIVFDVYDSSFKSLLKSQSKSRFVKIAPFQTGEVLSFFKVPLPVGQYWGDVKIFKNGDVVWNEKAIFTVKESGTLPPQPKEPFLDRLPIDLKWMVALLFMALATVIAAVSLVFRGRRRKQNR